MRVLAVLRTADYAAAYEALLAALTERGHEVQVVVDAPPLPFDPMAFLGLELRRALLSLRRGTADEEPSAILGALPRGILSSPGGRRLAAAVLRLIDRLVPPRAALDEFVRSRNPEIALIVPPAPAGVPDDDYERSTRSLGVATYVMDTIPDEDSVTTAQLVAAFETAAARAGTSPVRVPWWGSALRPVLVRAAAKLSQSAAARKQKEARQQQIRQQRHADLNAARMARSAAKQEAEAAAAVRRQQEAERSELDRQERARAAARAYETYLFARERIRRMQASCSGGGTLTDSEQRVLASLSGLWDATPETIATLRRQYEPLTGVRVADYDVPSSESMLRLKREVSMLRRQVGSDLFVQELPVLGGFGYNRNGELYNADTLKFFKVLIALQDAAVLPAYRDRRERTLVWEIGGGWGGFAFQFKTVCSNVTYLITGAPEQLLLAAVYLMTAWPNARVRFHGDVADAVLFESWQDADFIMAPESALASLRPPRVDLTLDLMALRSMSGPRVCAHIERSYAFGSRYFYSLLSDGRAADDAAAVVTGIARWYWPHPIPPRRDQSATAIAEPDRVTVDAEYSQLVGWRRLRVA